MSNKYGSLTGHGLLLLLTLGIGNIPYAVQSWMHHRDEQPDLEPAVTEVPETEESETPVPLDRLGYPPSTFPPPRRKSPVEMDEEQERQWREEYSDWFTEDGEFSINAGLDPYEMTEDMDEFSKEEWFACNGHLDTGDVTVYVLRQEEGKYYVGQTNDLWRRFDEHREGAVPWTAMYPPIEVVEITRDMTREEATEAERNLTLEKMSTYGWQNVRGGPWTDLDMEGPPSTLSRWGA